MINHQTQYAKPPKRKVQTINRKTISKPQNQTLKQDNTNINPTKLRLY